MSVSAVEPIERGGLMRPAGRAVAVLVATALLGLALAHIVPAWSDMSLHLGDTDNAMRLVEVRSLLDGRGWYDLFEPRMNAPIGLLSHWSRLFDAALATLVLAFQPWLGRVGAELAMRGVWPLLVLAGTLAAFWRIGNRLGGRPVAVLTIFAALNTLAVISSMLPGSIDHTGFEAMATLWVFAILCGPRADMRSGAAAGLLAGLALAISLEALPLLAVAGVLVGLDWAVRGEPARAFAIGFGSALAIAVPTLLMAGVAPARWLVPVCDTLSPAWAAPASLGGLGLAAGALLGPPTRTMRLAALAGVGALGLASVLYIAPHCLSGPYAEIDPRLQHEWLDDVLEAYNIVRLARVLPGTATAMMAAPLLALVAGVLLWRRGEPGARDAALVMTVGGLAGTAVLAWEFRGEIYASLFAVPLLVAGAHQLITRREQLPPWIPAALASLLVVGGGAVLVTGRASVSLAGPAAAIQENSQHCDVNADYADLAGVTRGTILNQVDTGPEILAGGPVSVVAGPYHRNAAGILDASMAFAGFPEGAHAIVQSRHAEFVLLCRISAETAIVREENPDGLAARLMRGDTPGWLAPVPLRPGSELALWRVRR